MRGQCVVLGACAASRVTRRSLASSASTVSTPNSDMPCRRCHCGCWRSRTDCELAVSAQCPPRPSRRRPPLPSSAAGNCRPRRPRRFSDSHSASASSDHCRAGSHRTAFDREQPACADHDQSVGRHPRPARTRSHPTRRDRAGGRAHGRQMLIQVVDIAVPSSGIHRRRMGPLGRSMAWNRPRSSAATSTTSSGLPQRISTRP